MFFKPIGSNIIRLNDVYSTNNYAAELLNQTNLPNGTIIVSERQTKGRGQRGSSWESEPGKNITCSIVLYPNISIDQSFEIIMMAALSVYDLLNERDFDPIKMKWPNDVFVRNKKVAGILIENSISKGKIQHSIIGIGLNVNQTSFRNDKAASMLQLSGKEWDLNQLLDQLLNHLNGYYLKVQQKQSLMSLYEEKTLGWQKNRTYITDSGREFVGKIVGYSADGGVKILSEEETKNYQFKEVQFVI